MSRRVRNLLLCMAFVWLASMAKAGPIEMKRSFQNLLFIGEQGKVVQFDSSFNLKQGPTRIHLPSRGRAGITTSTISPDARRIFLGYQGQESPLAVLNTSPLEIVEFAHLKFPEPKKPYSTYQPKCLVAVSSSQVYISDESFWAQEPPFDYVLVDLEKVTIEKKENRMKKHDSYYHQSRCDVSPDGQFLLCADSYQIQFIDLKSDTLIWLKDYQTDPHEILSRKVDWSKYVVEIIWSTIRDSGTTFESAKINLASGEMAVSPVEKPWNVGERGKETFLWAFSKAYAESGQGQAYGESAIIDDKLRAVKDKLTPLVIDLFSELPAQVYISPEGEYVLANEHPRYDYERFSDGWILIDMLNGRVVENNIAEVLKGFGEQLIGVYFTQ